MEKYTLDDAKEIMKTKHFFLDICLILFIVGLCMFSYQKGEWAGMENMCEEDEEPAYNTLTNKYVCWNEDKQGVENEVQLFINGNN